MNNELLEHYRCELASIQDLSEQFSKQYHEIAGAITFNPKQNPDPHIARLIESIAFLNARVSKKIDDSMPRMQKALLKLIYPEYQNPSPSTAIIEVEPQTAAKPFMIPKGSLMETDPTYAQSCQLQTAYDVNILPIKIVAADYIGYSIHNILKSEAAIHLKIEIENPDLKLAQIGSTPLRFYIDSIDGNGNNLFELLVEHTQNVEITCNDHSHMIDSLPIPVGFAMDEHVYPTNSCVFSGYHLLSELFGCPEKFYFFDLDLSSLAHTISCSHFDVVFHLSKAHEQGRNIRVSNFKLNCVPVVNAFPKIIEPVNIDHHLSDYPLIADIRRPKDFIIHHIQWVNALDQAGNEFSLSPLYRTLPDSNDDLKFKWNMERLDNECVISITDPNGRMIDQNYSLTISALCTNGELLTHYFQNNPNLSLQFIEAVGPVEKIKWVSSPTNSGCINMQNDNLYQLNSHLNLNLNQLLQQDGSQIRSLLQLYNPSNHPAQQQLVNVISHITTEPCAQRVYREGVSAICRGLKITLYVNTKKINIGYYWLVFKTLEKFLSQYSSNNSFIQLNIFDTTKNKELYQWPAIVGNKPLL